MQKHIHHVIVVWDETDHVSTKRSKTLSRIFWQNYTANFPEGAKTSESPMIVSTKSPILSPAKVQQFLHQGQFVPFSGKNKDLGIVKFCLTGLVDQNEKFHFILDDLRTMRHEKGDPPLLADMSAMVIFITSDWGQGMVEAFDYIMKRTTPPRTNFSAIRVQKSLSQGDQRMAYAGQIVGLELQKRFVRLENDALLLEIEN